jgi:hypothetical protein
MSKLIGSFGGRRGGILCTALIGGISLAVPAKAALILSFSDGITTLFAPAATTDMNGNSATSLSTTLVFPSFSVDIAVADSNATVTSGQQAYLETSTIQITDRATTGIPVTLTVKASDTGWTIPGTSGSLLQLGSAMGGSVTKLLNNGSDTVTFSSTVSTDGGALVQSTSGQTSNITAASPSPQGFNVPDASFNFLRTGTFDLSNTAVVTLTNSGDEFNINGTTTVIAIPEPASCALVLLGSTGMLLGRRRRLA